MDDTPPPPADAPGLPPVVPPTGRMIAQFFTIPLIIVVGISAIVFGFTWLAGGIRTPEGFLDGLRSTNPEIRWRAASDLAQVLLRDDTLAADTRFGLQLTSLLQTALAELKKPAKPAATTDDARDIAREKQRRLALRSECQYLIACVGNLSVPVGATLLGDMATQTISPDEKTDALLRRQAAWAIASLGNGRQRFDKLPSDKKQAALSVMDAEAAKVGDSANWSRTAAEILRGQSSGGVIATLAKYAGADDPFVRKEAALALAFWTGSADENRLAEETLLRLARDDGHGRSIEITDKD